MEKGKAAEPARRTTAAVKAARRLRTAGWWGLSEGERRALRPLLSAGLEVGANFNFRRLGRSPALVRGRTKGGASLWASREGDGALRSYFSSSLGDVLVAAPATDSIGSWHASLEADSTEGLTFVPLEDVRLLSASLGAFNEESGGFDFFWDRLPAREYEEPEEEAAVAMTPAVADALDSIVEDPAAESLDALAKRAGREVADCAEAVRFVREFPLGWRFSGPRRGEAGLVVVYERLGEDQFGGIRGAVRGVPYCVLEGWGREDGGSVYFAELVVPAAALVETCEYIRRASSAWGGAFSSGFYETKQRRRFVPSWSARGGKAAATR